MGMPACTITSETAHGGIVTVGFPQVLIGEMPASRIGDLHVCPMVTGIVPHVGGPFVLGSMTVLVGMMPQSRVTDQLVCVGPPDVAVMGCETVLVGMAGAGGAAGAVAGISAMGASVPAQAPASAASSQPTAEMQQDGTIKYSAPPGGHLPAATLSSPGFPDLPAKEARNFQTAQPVNIPPGTTLYRVTDNPAKAAGPYWSPDVFPSEDAFRQTCAVKPEWNKAQLIAVMTVQPPGLKAWAGAAAKQEGLAGDAGGMQIFADPSKLSPSTIFQTSWSAAAEQAQAAKQAVQAAQAAANQAQQAAAQGAAAAKQAIQDAQTQAQQAAQQAVQAAQKAAQEAVQQAQKAQQAAQQATQQAKQAAQQAAQQAQQAAQQGKAAALQAAAQAQQQAKETEQQAQKAAQQAQNSAQQAEQSAQQAQQAVQQAGQQAGQGLPKGLP